MAHKGTSTFIMQRASAVLLLPLAAWFLFTVISHAGDSFTEAKAWLSAPVNKVLLGAFVTIGAFHMRIGMMEVIVDYFDGGLRGALNGLNWLAALGVVAATWWSLLNI